MREFGKKFAAWMLAVAMVLSLLPANAMITHADEQMEAVTFANASYPYGKNMSASSATLVTEVKEGTPQSVQWYYSTEQNGTYHEVAGATSLTYTFSPKVGDKYWYKCRVNGVDTKAVQLVKANRYGAGDIRPLRCYDMWYVSNGSIAYTVWSGNTQFDVIGIYEKNGTEYWINTSYNSCWGTNNVSLSAFRFAFDTANDHKVNMEAQLAEDVTSFGIGADVMLADGSITSYSDSASLKANYTGDTVQSVQMVGAATVDDAQETDPAFVLSYDTIPSYYWLGYYYQRQYNKYNTGTTSTYGVKSVKEIAGESVVTEVAGIDSGMTTTWSGLEKGSTVRFSYGVGSVKQSGAQITANAEVTSKTIHLSGLDTAYEYRLVDEEGNAVTDWTSPTASGSDYVIDFNEGLQSDTAYTVQARKKKGDQSEIKDVTKVETAIDPSNNGEKTDSGQSAEVTCTETASSLRFGNLKDKYSYQLQLKNENGSYEAATQWLTPENGVLTFERLQPLTKYYLVAKSSKNNASDPVEYETHKAKLATTKDAKVQVNLAVGQTKVNYQNFEQTLKNYLLQDGALKEDDIKIEAANSNVAQSQNSFTWNEYDHTNGSTSNTTNKHLVNVGSQTTNAYNSKNRHIESYDNGTKMTFYGYGSSAYKDFFLYANKQTTRKEIEFNVTEGQAYDAFDGAGFFVNTSVTGTYSASTSNSQRLNGYLVFLQYNGSGKGSAMKVFQLTGINTYLLQQGGYIFDSLSSLNSSQAIYGGTVKLIAVADTSYSDKKYRKIHIKALPTSIQVWYSEGTSPSAQNVDLTSKNTDRDNYLVKWNCQGSDTKQTVVPVQEAYDNTYDFRGGFGPLASYRSHGCEQLTDFTMSNISLDMDVVKDLTTIIRTPDWQEGYDSYLVNLNEAAISDFSNTYSTAEIINRLVEDDISYVGWGSSTNETDSRDFIAKVGSGEFVSTANGNTDSQIKLIADYIKSHSTRNVLHANTTVKDQPESEYNRYVYLLEDDWTLVGDDDTLLDDAGWTVTYSPTSLDFIQDDDTLDVAKDKEFVVSHGNISRATFDKEGYYQIYRASEYDKKQDQAEVYLQVHTNKVPEPDFETEIDTQNSTCTITSASKDDFPAFTEKISVTKIADGKEVPLIILDETSKKAASGDAIVYESGTKKASDSKVSFSYLPNVIYMIRQTVTDCDGEVKTIAKQFSVNQSRCQKPFNSFSVNKNDLLTKKDTLTITDQSKAVDGSDVTATYYIQDTAGYYYQITDANKLVRKSTSKAAAMQVAAKTEKKDIDLSALSSGTYTISMTAQAAATGKTASAVTAEVKKYLTVRKGVKISWDLSGGTIDKETSRASSIEEAGASYTLPTEVPEKKGYEFIGWKAGSTTYQAGQNITCPDVDTTYTAVYRQTTELTIASTWKYATGQGHYHDAAHASLYPNTLTLQLKWKKPSDSDWSNYSGRVTKYQSAFTIVSEQETKCEQTEDQIEEKTGSLTISGLEMTDASGNKYEYQVENVGGTRQSYTTTLPASVQASGNDTLKVVTQFTPENASFDCKVQTQWNIPQALYDPAHTTLSATLQYNSWNYEKEGVTYQQKWNTILQDQTPRTLTKENGYSTSYSVWKWEQEEAGQEAAATPYRYRAKVNKDDSTFNQIKGLPSYVTVESMDTHYQYGVDQQDAAVIEVSLDPEYFTYDKEENKITLNQDVTLEEPLMVYDDIKLDLNGHKLLAKEEGTDTIKLEKPAVLTVINAKKQEDVGSIGGAANASWVDQDGNRHYEELKEAIKHAPEDTTQITLEKNTTLDENLIIPDNTKLVVKPDVKLTVPEEVTVTIPEGTALENQGSVDVNGTLTNEGDVKNSGTLDVTGTLTNKGDVESSGTIDVAGTVKNEGDLVNNGTVDIKEGAVITNDKKVSGDGTVTNAGTIEGNGTWENEITNKPGSSLNAEASWTDGDKTYYGSLKDALEKAPKDALVTVRKDCELPKDVTIPDNITIDITKDATLTVPEDQEASIPAGTTVNNKGTLDVKGTLENAGDINNTGAMKAEGEVTSTGTITNDGILDVKGTLTNDGTMKNHGTVSIEPDAAVTNNGTLQNKKDAEIKNEGTLVNNKTLENETGAAIDNKGSLENKEEASLTNEGTLDVNGTLTNDGNMKNHGTVSIEPDAKATNNGTLQNKKDAEIKNEGTLVNNKTLENETGAAIDNKGSIENKKDAVITNDGKVAGEGTVANAGKLESAGTWENEITNVPGSSLNAEASWTDGDKTYYGSLKDALEKASEGALVTVRKDCELPKDVTIPDNITIDITKDATLTIPEDCKAAIPAGTTVNNKGTLEVKGTITNNGAVKNDGVLDVEGTLANTGDVTNTGAMKVEGEVTSDGTITNDGTLDVKGTLTNDGDIVNKGSLTIQPGASLNNNNTLENKKGAAFVNEGTVNGAGTIDNAGTITNRGTLENEVSNKPGSSMAAEASWTDGEKTYYGSLKEALEKAAEDSVITIKKDVTLPSDAVIPDQITIVVEKDASLTIPKEREAEIPKNTEVINNGTITVDGTLVNEGTLQNKGTLEVNQELINRGDLDNRAEAAIVNDGLLRNEQNASLTNKGSLTNKKDAVLENEKDAVMTNRGSIANEAGAAVRNSGEIRSSEGAEIANAGVIENGGEGSIQDQNTIRNEEGGTLTSEASYTNGEKTIYGTLEDALTKAKSGSTITIKQDVTIKEDIVIPKDVTMVIPEDVTVTISKDKTVKNQGTLINEGQLSGDGAFSNDGTVSNKGEIAIKGSIESTENATITGNTAFSAKDETEKEKDTLKDYFDEAKEAIDDMEHLSDEEKEEAKKQLEQQYDAILKELEESDSRNAFDEAETKAKEQVDQAVAEQNKKQYEKDAATEEKATITGTVSADAANKEDITLTLRIGNTIMAATKVEADGSFHFDEVADGVYNIVASSKTQEKTSYVTVKNGVVQMENEISLNDQNTKVVVKNGAPDVCVDGLQKVYETEVYQSAIKEEKKEQLQSEIRLTSSRQKTPSDQIKEAIPDTKTAARYMEFTADLHLSWPGGETKVISLFDTESLLLVAVPLKDAEKGKTGYQVYRSHIADGEEVIEQLPELTKAEQDAPDKEGFYMDADYAYIYCHKFSTYAIAYDKKQAGQEEATTEAAATTEQVTTEAQTTTEAKTDKKKNVKKQENTGNSLAKLTNLPLLLAKGKGGNKKISLSWLKVKKATKYEVYWSYCDGKTNYKLLKRTGKMTAEHKKLSNKRAYKYFVIAYRTVNGKKEYLAKSPSLHVAMKQDKKTNVKKVTVNARSLTLRVTEKATVTATYTKENAKKKLVNHVAALRFYSDNKKVAKVDKNGLVTAKKPGSCLIYVITNNGAYAKIKVTVRKNDMTELSRTKTAKKGMLITDKKSGGVYKVLSTESGKETVELVKPIDNSVTSFSTEAVIMIGNKNYVVSKIGADAFAGCSKLKTVTLGSGAIEIGKRAFKDCKALTSVSLPQWLFAIGEEAFAGCTKLSSLKVQGMNITNYSCGKDAFKGTSAKMKVTCPAAKLTEYTSLFRKRGLAKTSTFKAGK